MNKEQLIEKAQAAFDFNKNLKVAHVTADGTVFPNRNLAKLHAKELDSDEILEVTRSKSILNGAIKAVKDKIMAGGKAGFEGDKDAENKAAEEAERLAAENAQLLAANEGDDEEMTSDQMILRLVKDFTKEELQAVASEFELPKNRFMMMKEETLANFLISESSESQKELLVQKIEDKKED